MKAIFTTEDKGEDCPFSRQDLITAVEGIFARCYQDGGQYLQSHGWYGALDNLDVVLAEFVARPADDDELVTAEWLIRSGFKQEIVNHPVFIERGDMTLCIQYKRAWLNMGYRSQRLKPVETRGDVRRLCAALGIELEESSGGEQRRGRFC